MVVLISCPERPCAVALHSWAQPGRQPKKKHMDENAHTTVASADDENGS